MKSVMTHQFNRIPQANIERSVFNRTHGYKTTFNEGYLVPFLLDEALPGDTFNVNATMFARLASPLKYPIMDNMFLDVFYFFVPNRLVWDNWAHFLGEKDNPGDSTTYVVPIIAAPAVTGFAAGSLADYFGLPTEIADIEVNALPFRCYNLIYNQWFRDENIINSAVVDMDDADGDITDYVLRRRGKRHDYFTSALPWPQKGTAVALPLGTEAPVLGIGQVAAGAFGLGAIAGNKESDHGAADYANSAQVDWSVNPNGRFVIQEDPAHAGYPYIRADLTSATAAIINELRQAFQIQKLYERFARGGTRLTEIIQSCFGVVSPDARLQRPEYLGGTSSPVRMTTVPNTSATATEKQASLAAYATITVNNCGFTKSFVEHGYVIGLVSVRADLTYQQGLHRLWSRSTRFDFYWPALAHIGEQAVLTKEIYCDGTADDNLVFGYQERFAEYRYFPSQITGTFRSNYATPLDAWHLSQDFANHPTLSQAFIEEEAPMSRVVAVTTVDHFIFDSYIEMRCTRPMPVYSVPGLIDHF